MEWQKMREWINGNENIQSLLENPDFIASEENLFMRIAIRLRKKGRSEDVNTMIKGVFEQRNNISKKETEQLKHFQADCFLDREKFQEAIVIYDALLLEGADAVAFANRGLSYWNLGDLQRALNDYLEAARLDPASEVSNRNAGELLMRLDEPRRAVQYLLRAIKINRRSARSFSLLGAAYWTLEEGLKSYKTLKKAAALDPHDNLARLGLRKFDDLFDSPATEDPGDKSKST